MLYGKLPEWPRNEKPFIYDIRFLWLLVFIHIIVNFNRNIEAGFCIWWFPTFLCQDYAVTIINVFVWLHCYSETGKAGLERLLTRLKLTSKSSLEFVCVCVCVCVLNVKIIVHSLCFAVNLYQFRFNLNFFFLCWKQNHVHYCHRPIFFSR